MLGRLAKKNEALAITRKGGELRIVLRTQRNQSRGFTMTSMLQIAYTKVIRIADVARFWKCDRAAIRRIQHSVAQALLVSQSGLLERVADFMAQARPTVFCINLAWDETSEKLRLPVHHGLLPEQCRSSWHVLISITEYVVGFCSADGQERSRFLQVLRSPVPLLSTGAECLLDGLFCMPSLQPFRAFERAGQQSAKFTFYALDRDGATSNERLVAAAMALLPADALICDRVCGNHSTNLVEGAVLGAHWLQLLSRMYSVALLLRQGAYFLRLVHSVTVVIDQAVDRGAIARGLVPPEEAGAYSLEMGDFVLRNMRNVMAFRKRATVHDDSDDETVSDQFNKKHDQALEAWLQAWREYVAVFNGPLWKPMRHFCSHPGCCNNFDAAATKEKMRRALVGLTFRAMPMVPVKTKWTKTLPCVIWFVLAVACLESLQVAWPVAFNELSVTVASLPRDAGGVVDHVEMEQIHWHAVQGSRARAGLAMIRDPRTPTKLLVLGLTMEVTMHLTRWFMKRGAPSTRFRPSPTSGLMDFVNLEQSPVTMVLQYFSAMLAGQAQRLKLLWLRDGSASWDEWASRHPDDLRELRHAITIAASWVHRRFWQTGMTYPWRLAGFADNRVSLAERQRRADEFWALPAEALDPFCSVRLRARLGSPGELFAPEVQMALRRWAWSVRLSIAPVEWIHGRNRRRSDQSATWAGFAAQYLNQVGP